MSVSNPSGGTVPDLGYRHHIAEGSRGAGKGKRTRAAIQIALCECLDRLPFSEVTVSEICKAAGLSNGTFYIYFQNRKDLAAEVLLQFTGYVQSTMRAASQGDPEQSARAATAAYVHLFEQNLGLMRCMLRHLDEFPEAKAVFHTLNHEWLGDVAAKKVRSLERDGHTVDPDEWMRRAYALGGMTDSYLAGLLLDRDPNMEPFSQDREAIIDTLDLLWNRGMQP